MNENTSTANAGRKNTTSLEEKRKKYSELQVSKIKKSEVDSWLNNFFDSARINCMSFDFKSNQRTATDESPIRSSSADSIKRDLEELAPFVNVHVILDKQMNPINKKRKDFKQKREAELEAEKKRIELELEKAKKEKEEKENEDKDDIEVVFDSEYDNK